MAEARRTIVALVAACAVAMAGGPALADAGWSISPVVVIPRTQYSVYGPTPECTGAVLVDSAIRRNLSRIGLTPVDPETQEPSRLALVIGEALNLFGMGTVLQTYAECAEVCALIPLDAVRVTSLVAYVADGPTSYFRTQPFGHRGEFFHLSSEIDTTRLTDEGRLVCTHVMSWLTFDRRVFLVVGYER